MLDSLSTALRHFDMIENAFDRPFALDRRRSLAPGNFYPPSDLVETDKEWIVSMELPGVDKDDISLSVEGSYLKVKATRTREEASEGETYRHREISYGSYERRFKLGTDLKNENITAKLDNGILEVRIPKEVKKKPKEIAITIA